MGGIMIMKRIFKLAAGALALACLVSAVPIRDARAQAAPKQETLSETYRVTGANDVEFQKIAPFKVFDNLYYVGPGYVGVWLIPTAQGIIMIDSAQEPYVDYVMDNVKKVGFDLKDIKYILISHGHLDHFGGAARIQEASGARVVALEQDWKMIEEVGARPGRGGGSRGGLPGAEQAVVTTERLVQMQGIEVLVMIHSWAAGTNGYPGGGVLER